MFKAMGLNDKEHDAESHKFFSGIKAHSKSQI